MSIASTQLAMGYVGFTHATDNCDACDQSHRAEEAQRLPMHSGLRCTRGGFWVSGGATCRHFQRKPDAPAPAGLIQIGPTDI